MRLLIDADCYFAVVHALAKKRGEGFQIKLEVNQF